MIKASWPILTQNLLVLDSREAILDLSSLLEALAERCGQAGAMHWLPYFLDEAVTRHRVPYLVLALRPEDTQGGPLSVDDVEAAALFFEYRVFGIRSGAVATGDAVGFSSVIGPKGKRALVAATAARALMARGASIVLATYEGADEPDSKPLLSGWTGVFSACRQRMVGRTLRLLPTFDATLAQMGKKTRTNLRYYRRRIEELVPCEYVPDAAQALRGADLQEINKSSLNPVEPAEFERRVRAASDLPGSFLSGLRRKDGTWLSLLGGWRQGNTTVVQWQLNSTGYEKLSIGTAVRAYFLEHEISRGAERLLMYGGTPHSMRHAFADETVADLIVRRDTLYAWLLLRASRLVARVSAPGKTNFLASTLQDPELRWWAPGPAADPAAKAPVAKPARSSRAA